MESETLLLEIRMMLEQDAILVIFQFKAIILKILMLDYKLHVIFNVMLLEMLVDQLIDQ
jgi:hypothetical protein